MNVVIVETGYSAYGAAFGSIEEAIRQTISGEAEIVSPLADENIAVVISKNQNTGKYNRAMDDDSIICGRFLVCGIREGKLCGLSESQMKRMESRFTYYENFDVLENDCIRVNPVYRKERPSEERLGAPVQKKSAKIFGLGER